jgi:hypothetical protein
VVEISKTSRWWALGTQFPEPAGIIPSKLKLMSVSEAASEMLTTVKNRAMNAIDFMILKIFKEGWTW